MFILGINTAGTHLRVSVVHSQELLDQSIEAKQSGIDRLFPLIQEVFARHAIEWPDVAAIGVSVGPGNFNGIRTGVSASRGLALSLQIPVIGVNNFDAVSFGYTRDLTAMVRAVKNKYFCRVGVQGMPFVGDLDELARVNSNNLPVIGHDAHLLADRMGIPKRDPKLESSHAIAMIALDRMGEDHPLPKPLYVSRPRVDLSLKKPAWGHVKSR